MGIRLRALLAVSAAVAATMLCLTVPASADPIPSGCTVTQIDSMSKKMTCTNMAPTQQWALEIYCVTWFAENYFVGNKVTGNGTSTARCGFSGVYVLPGAWIRYY